MLLVFFVTTANSQSWGQNSSSKWLYTSPDTTKVGIGTTTECKRDGYQTPTKSRRINPL